MIQLNTRQSRRLRRNILKRAKQNRQPKREEKQSQRPWTNRLGESIDNVLGIVAPVAAQRRREARLQQEALQLRAEFVRNHTERLGRFTNTNRGDRLRDGLTSSVSPDTVLDEELADLQMECADLYRKNNIAHSAIEGRVAHEVGTGIKCRPEIIEYKDRGVSVTDEQAQEWNFEIEELIRNWSDHGCDKSRRLSFSAIQRIVDRSYATFGEAFIEVGYWDKNFNPILNLAVNVISPERIETPPEEEGNDRVKLGIVYDQNDVAIAYWVRSDHPGDDNFVSEVKYKRVDRFDKQGREKFYHVFEPLVPEQTRGLPWLASVKHRIQDLEQFFEAELIGKQIEACFGLLIRTGEDTGPAADLAKANSTETDSNGKRIEDISPGMIEYIGQDDEPFKIDPNRPGATFVPFVEQSLRTIAAGLNYPYEYLAKNFFRITYSSGRLSIEDGKIGFALRGDVLQSCFLRPFYRRIVEDGVFTKSLSIPIDMFRSARNSFQRHRWEPPSQSSMDEEKDAKADSIQLEDGTMSLHDACSRRSRDYRTVQKNLTEEARDEARRRVETEAYERELRVEMGLPVNDGDSKGSEDQPSEEKEPAMAG